MEKSRSEKLVQMNFFILGGFFRVDLPPLTILLHEKSARRATKTWFKIATPFVPPPDALYERLKSFSGRFRATFVPSFPCRDYGLFGAISFCRGASLTNC